MSSKHVLKAPFSDPLLRNLPPPSKSPCKTPSAKLLNVAILVSLCPKNLSRLFFGLKRSFDFSG